MVRFSEIFKDKGKGEKRSRPDGITPPKPIPSPKVEPEPPLKIRVIKLPALPAGGPEEASFPPAQTRETLQSLTPAAEPNPLSFIEAAKHRATTPGTPHKELALSEIVRTQGELNPQKAGELFQQAHQAVYHIWNEITVQKRLLKEIELSPLKEIIEQMINLVITGDRNLLQLATVYYSKEDLIKPPDNYEVNHQTEVGILALYLGAVSGYNKSHLVELGLIAFLYHLLSVQQKDYQAGKSSRVGRDSAVASSSADAGANLKDILYLIKEVLDVRYLAGREDAVGRTTLTKAEEYAQVIQVAD